jgi:hypothetical protein
LELCELFQASKRETLLKSKPQNKLKRRRNRRAARAVDGHLTFFGTGYTSRCSLGALGQRPILMLQRFRPCAYKSAVARRLLEAYLLCCLTL